MYRDCNLSNFQYFDSIGRDMSTVLVLVARTKGADKCSRRSLLLHTVVLVLSAQAMQRVKITRSAGALDSGVVCHCSCLKMLLSL